jgi:hypothetical protein
MMSRIYAGLTNNMVDKLVPDYHTHDLHCIDYLRQGIMCSADLAMEPHEPTDPDDNGPGDGSWNGHHGEYLLRRLLARLPFTLHHADRLVFLNCSVQGLQPRHAVP